jgi:predicted ferric reductase
MKHIQRIYLLLIALLSVLWLLADTVLSEPYNFFSLRTSLMNYTGIIGIGVMSIGMLLAIRPAIAKTCWAVWINRIACINGWASRRW